MTGATSRGTSSAADWRARLPSFSRTSIPVTVSMPAEEEDEVGGRPERHVLPEDPVPEVVEGQRGQAEGHADHQQHRADRHPPAVA